MAETLSSIGAMVGADIKDLRLNKIDSSIADSKYIRNDITTSQTIKSDLYVQGIFGRQYHNEVLVKTKSDLDIDLNSLGIDGLKAIYDIKLYDDVSDSDTYDTYINSEDVCTISIAKDGKSCKIINYDNKDQTFLINIKDI